MSRRDLVLPRGTRTAPPPKGGARPPARGATGGSFASLVRSGGSGGAAAPSRTAGVRNEQAAIDSQVAKIQRSAAPSSFKSLTQSVAQGTTEHAKDSGILGAVGNFLSDVPLVGSAMHTTGKILQSEPVVDLLRTIDIPRAAIVSGLQEGGELIGAVPENNKDFGEQFNQRMSYRELIGDVPGLPGWAEGIAGFAGDIAFDPTSYIGVGLAGKGAEAVVAAGRRELAEQVVTRAGEAGLKDEALAAAERVAAEAGQRGRGALTARGLKRAGASPELLDELGMKPNFGVQVRVPGAEKTIGGQRVVQAAEDLKGAVKARLAKTTGGRIMRQIRNPDFDGVLTDILLSGKGSAYERASAARVLAATHLGRGESAALIDRMSRWTRSELKPYLKKNVDWNAAMHEVESGAIKSEPAKKLNEFFSTLADAAEAAGIPFDRREGYIPHRATLEAKNFMTDPEAMRRFSMDTSKLTEKFERPRTVQVGDKFLGETVKDTSIRSLNDISNRVLGFDWFETNPDKLIAKTLGEAGDAAERHARNRALAAMGAPIEEVQRVVKTVDVVDPKTAERIKKLSSLESRARAEEAKSLRNAVNKRQQAVQAASRALQSKGKKLTAELSNAEIALDANVDKLKEIAMHRDMAQGALESANTALSHATAQASTAQRVQRAAVLKRVDQLRDEVARREARVASLAGQHDQLLKDTVEAEAMYSQAVLQHMDDARLEAIAAGRKVSQTNMRAVARRRAASEGEAVKAATAGAQETGAALGTERQALEAAQAGVQSGRQEATQLASFNPGTLAEAKTVKSVRAEIGKLDAGERAARLETQTLEGMIPELRARAEELETAAQEGFAAHAKSYKKRKLTMTGERGMAVFLADRARMLSDVLEQHGLEGHVAKMAKWEADALAHEMDALQFADEAALRRDTITALRDGRTRQVISQKIKDGFKDIGGGYQSADPVLQKQLQAVTSIFDSPKATQALLKGWDSWNKWFRTWAVTSPGFIVRNLEGGWLNNLVAGVKMQDYTLFKKHMAVYTSGAGWEDRFIAKYGIDELNKFRGALDAIAGTGWGQSAQEAGIGLFSKRGARKAWDKTLGTENPVSVGVRNLNESAEELMRGAHAYMVFRRSGKMASGAWPVNDAINSVAKYHFNYRDISQFDRAAKRVIPFWTFMSRNIPLQLDILARHPDVLNRTYGNLKRTLEAGQQEEPLVPAYFKNMGAIHVGDIPGLGALGDSEYLMLDLPFLRVQDDLSKFTDIEKLFSDMNPAIKTPLELQAHEQFFSGIPLSDTRMETPPAGATLPGVKQLLEGIGWLEKDNQGRPVMSDSHSYAFGALNPLANRVERVNQTAQKHPGEPGYEREQAYLADKRKEALLSILFGVGVRTNAPERQQGELLRRSRELKTLLDQAASRGYTKG